MRRIVQPTVLVFVTDIDMTGFGHLFALQPEWAGSLSAHDLASDPIRLCRGKQVMQVPSIDGMPRSRLKVIARLVYKTRTIFYSTAARPFKPFAINDVAFLPETIDHISGYERLKQDRGQLFAAIIHHHSLNFNGNSPFGIWVGGGVEKAMNTAL